VLLTLLGLLLVLRVLLLLGLLRLPVLRVLLLLGLLLLLPLPVLLLGLPTKLFCQLICWIWKMTPSCTSSEV